MPVGRDPGGHFPCPSSCRNPGFREGMQVRDDEDEAAFPLGSGEGYLRSSAGRGCVGRADDAIIEHKHSQVSAPPRDHRSSHEAPACQSGWGPP